MVTRISTISAHTKAVSDITRLQNVMADVQQQISSGRKTNSFIEMGNEISRVQGVESTIKATGRYVGGNNLILARLRMMRESIVQLNDDVLSKLSQNLVTENSPSANVFNLTEFVETALDQVRDALNVEIGGRSLFAGSKTDQPAVGDLNATTNVLGSTVSSNYYQGDEFIASVKASDNLELSYGVTAADPAFQNLIGALHTAAEFDSSGDQGDAQLASTFLEDARQGLATLLTQINTDIGALEQANEQHANVEIQLNIILDDMVGTDVVEASVQVALNEAVLTATMQTFARISNLTLADFLR